MGASYDVVDGPNDEGEMFTRPAILVDAFPSPYPNEESARYANGGALPPDLSVYTTAKHEGVDYIFALLISYRDPPAGIECRDGLYYNPYFPGGLIGMPPPLHSDGLEGNVCQHVGCLFLCCLVPCALDRFQDSPYRLRKSGDVSEHVQLPLLSCRLVDS